MTAYMLVQVFTIQLLASEEIPEKLVEQLANNGIMIIPIGSNSLQHLYAVTKDSYGKIKKQSLLGVTFISLTDAKKQWPY